MKNLKHVLSVTLAVLAVLILTGCDNKDNPVRTSLDVDTSTMTLTVGESATRTATTKAQWDYQITYTSSNPAVATVDQTGKVTGVSKGEAIITVHMDETKESWYAAKTLSYSVVVKELKIVTGITLDKPTMEMRVGDTGQLTATLAPDDATDKTVTWSSDKPAIASVDATGKVTAVAVGTATITAKAGDKTATCTVTVKKVTDLSMVDNAGGARSTMSTANCYMVHTAGDYKLPLVYGNAIKDGAANTAAYTGIANANTTTTFPNHAGNAITAPWITKATTGTGADKGMGIVVSTAELLWQDAQGLITAVGIIGDYLTLTVGKNATTQEGNAVIAAKDAGGNIVWSWHIWVTKETFADPTLTTVATGSHNYKGTPVNLGWVPTGGDGKQGYAPYYQWGRKDAFIPGTWNANTNHTVYDISNTAVTRLTYEPSTTATIADNIKNPTTFYNYSTTYGPCDTEYYNMWDAQQTGTGNITTATKKTVYDPCPAGFCVPTGNLYYFMGGNGTSRIMTSWDVTNKGATWDNTVVPGSITGTALFFPASGLRDYNDGSLGFVGAGYCWSASAYDSYKGHTLFFPSTNWIWDSYERASGFSVRAVAEE